MSEERQERLEQLRDDRQDDEAFAYNFERSHTVEELSEHRGDPEEELPDQQVSTAGRVMEIRNFGGIAFLDLRGETRDIQLVSEDEEVLGELEDLYRGDIIGVSGTLTYTDRDEFSLDIETIDILTRGLRQIPSDHYGVEDQETR